MDLKTLQDTPPWEWPSDAGKTFHETMIDSQANEADRLIAAALAGDLTVMNDELADALMAILKRPEEPEQLRATAALAFGPVLELVDMDGFEDPLEGMNIDDPEDGVPIMESTFHNIQELLHKLYLDESIPKEVRRRILEASVRAPEEWHQDAIRAAYSSGDKEWMLTAVFSMRWVQGFDDQILEALKSDDADIQSEAIQAAGNWELDGAWPHVLALVRDPATPKPLLLEAIAAVGSIHPVEAGSVLIDLADSEDEEIAEAADEAMAMAEAASGEDDDDEVEGDWVN